MDVKNQAVLVTGASRGLGRALMEGFARRGARVVGVARDAKALMAAVTPLRMQGLQVHALAYDVGDKQAIYPLVGAATALVGPLDVLVNNASSLGPTPLPLLLDTACEDLSQVLEVNVLGPFRLTKAVAGSMVLRGRGLVVNITSDAAVSAYPRWGAYGLSKAALDHLTRIWAAELEGSGVRLLSVDPGDMDTRMHSDAIPDADPATLAKPEDVAARILALVETRAIPAGQRFEAARWEAA
ncbi:SDR family oxidoreductase [Corallococcus praedator]|uniref:SDR family oxidoreductase n=1 Tax=Corallococcus praedator TaxID=2316724 RepID=A0ABX9QH76_9BACT|nr:MULTISPECIES: SDR family oxidoreductase [Corallococcus]RKH19666.1 SDR family oxidoreductase [Corallococcus sp. CA047B]RKH26307.1 SDR family oxidoreductase [Corallococcus sp. CA031C]RKI06134.1 SDR family oxidoreductase [Corallococcus praedator]